MKHGELTDRVKRLASRLMNEYPSFRNWCYHTLVKGSLGSGLD